MRYLAGDPVVARFCGLARLPTTRTLSHWLKQLTVARVRRLVELNRAPT